MSSGTPTFLFEFIFKKEVRIGGENRTDSIRAAG